VRIFLDTAPIWTIVHPLGGPLANDLRKKVSHHLEAGDEVAIAEICDYEARRELLRKQATRQLRNLDILIGSCAYHPIDTKLMRRAAEIWASMRRKGRPTGNNDSMDGDVILAAQALSFDDHLVVTPNTRHFAGICNATDVPSFLSV
jgi:predicted nucleic acid-binding protein